METAQSPYHFVPRTEVEVIGIAQFNLTFYIPQVVGAEGSFNSSLGAGWLAAGRSTAASMPGQTA